LPEVKGWIGNGIERLVHRALTGSMALDAEADRFQHALTVFKQAYHDINGTHVTIYPGVINGLEWIVAHKITTGVVTNKSREFTIPLLQRMQIDRFFSHVVCGDDVANKKPEPDALLHSFSDDW
jgi:phosphoglycolate phosphatase